MPIAVEQTYTTPGLLNLPLCNKNCLPLAEAGIPVVVCFKVTEFSIPIVIFHGSWFMPFVCFYG
jgi:hypothetical protein